MTHNVTVRPQTPEEREMEAKAVDEAVWLAMMLAQRAGWADVSDYLLDIKQVTSARRRAVEVGWHEAD